MISTPNSSESNVKVCDHLSAPAQNNYQCACKAELNRGLELVVGLVKFQAPDQLFVEPIIITPVLHKEFYDEKFIYKKVFDPLWRKAKSSLSKCKSLIIIGYSFPATDFHTRKLFQEGLVDNIVHELIIVNPDQNAIEETKRLTRFKRIRIFKSLEHFVQYRILEHIVLLCFCCLYPV
jgi:hypothetical protein